MHELASLPLAENIPIAFNSCRQGPRNVEWRDDKPAELCWTEAQVGDLSSSYSYDWRLHGKTKLNQLLAWHGDQASLLQHHGHRLGYVCGRSLHCFESQMA